APAAPPLPGAPVRPRARPRGHARGRGARGPAQGRGGGGGAERGARRPGRSGSRAPASALRGTGLVPELPAARPAAAHRVRSAPRRAPSARPRRRPGPPHPARPRPSAEAGLEPRRPRRRRPPDRRAHRPRPHPARRRPAMTDPTAPLADAGTDPADRSARITWSLIAEPSDPTAFAACAALGPAAALRLARRQDTTGLLRTLGGEVPRQPTDPQRGTPTGRAENAIARWTKRLERVDVDAVRQDARRRGIRVLTPHDQEWPELLDDLQESAPHCLWVQGPGRLDALLGGRTAALVGSRASTPYGEDTAMTLAAAFAAGGGTVVSGGAYGIDAAAHRGALAADGGATLAVLAGGLDRLYPRGNTRLLETIRARHLLVSEA